MKIQISKNNLIALYLQLTPEVKKTMIPIAVKLEALQKITDKFLDEHKRWDAILDLRVSMICDSIKFFISRIKAGKFPNFVNELNLEKILEDKLSSLEIYGKTDFEAPEEFGKMLNEIDKRLNKKDRGILQNIGDNLREIEDDIDQLNQDWAEMDKVIGLLTTLRNGYLQVLEDLKANPELNLKIAHENLEFFLRYIIMNTFDRFDFLRDDGILQLGFDKELLLEKIIFNEEEPVHSVA